MKAKDTINLMLSDWERARILEKRAFYERYSDTIRLCPENYCLAYRGQDKKFHVYVDEHATIRLHDKIQETIETWQGGSTAEAIATEIGKLFPLDFKP